MKDCTDLTNALLYTFFSCKLYAFDSMPNGANKGIKICQVLITKNPYGVLKFKMYIRVEIITAKLLLNSLVDFIFTLIIELIQI